MYDSMLQLVLVGVSETGFYFIVAQIYTDQSYILTFLTKNIVCMQILKQQNASFLLSRSLKLEQ